MTIEEFNTCAMGEISPSVYHIIEDVYCAYNRFNSKQSIAYFWNEHGEAGINTLMKPLNQYKDLKNETNAIDEQIGGLEAQIAALREERKAVEKKMEEIKLQCDLSWHWAENA